MRPVFKSLTVVSLFLLAIALTLQIPTLHNMVGQLLRQALSIRSAPRILPHYKLDAPAFLLPAFLTSSISNQQTPHNLKHFTTSISPMADSKSFFSAVESRRTIYQLSHESPISDARIKEIVTFALKHTPSSFNSQTSRVVLVLKKKHQELWDAIAEVYKAMLPEDKFNHAKQRFDGFRAGYGTVMTLTSRSTRRIVR